MAEITRRVPDCDDGERGERGKRGRRGHAGPTGPTGPAAPEGPPFRGAFPSPAIITKIYANASGSNVTGNGSFGAPYRTFQRAMQDVPDTIEPGNRVIVDITGLGLEVLPPNYALPAIDAPFGVEQAYTLPNAADYYPFTSATAFDIIAKPKLATLAQGSNTLGAGDISVSFDADTNLVIVQTNQDYGSADSLKGKLVQDPVGLRGLIWHNTAGPNSILYLTIAHVPDEFISPAFESPPTGFPPGFPQGFPVPVTPPLQIVEQSAAFQTQKEPNSILRGGFIMAGDGSAGVRGVDIQLAPPFTNPTAFDVEIWGGRTIFLEGCRLDGLLIAHSVGQVGILHTVVHDAIFFSEASTGIFASMLQNVSSLNLPSGPPAAIEAIGFVLDGCGAFGARYNPIQPAGRGPMVDLQLRNGVIMNSIPDLNFGQIAAPQNFPAPFVPFSITPALAMPGFGIVFRGGKGIIDHVKIFGAASDAIHAEAGGGWLELKSVTGGESSVPFVFPSNPTGLPNTPNGTSSGAGVGVFVADGAIVRVSDDDPVPGIPTTVTGVTVNGDMKVGTLVPRTWTDFRGTAPIKNEYDLTTPFVVASSGAVQPPGEELTGTGTGGRSGSRLFQKP